MRLFQIFDLTIYACIFRHFVEFIYASLPSTNDCQKSVCHFTDAKIQYAFLHKMPFYTTANLHYCLFTLLPKYRIAHISHRRLAPLDRCLSKLFFCNVSSFFACQVCAFDAIPGMSGHLTQGSSINDVFKKGRWGH